MGRLGKRLATLLRKAVWLSSGQRSGDDVRVAPNASAPASTTPLPAEAPGEAAKEEPTPPHLSPPAWSPRWPRRSRWPPGMQWRRTSARGIAEEVIKEDLAQVLRRPPRRRRSRAPP